MVGLLVDLFAEGFLVLATVDVHPRTASRFHVVLKSSSPFEAEAFSDDPGLSPLDLGCTGAVGASAGDEEEEAHYLCCPQVSSGEVQPSIYVLTSYGRMAACCPTA